MSNPASSGINRPNRPMSADGDEQVVISERGDGRKYRLTLRQVGWLGQTGNFYSLDENPSLTEPGSFRPLWFVAHEDKGMPAEVGSASLLRRLLGRFRRGSQ